MSSPSLRSRIPSLHARRRSEKWGASASCASAPQPAAFIDGFLQGLRDFGFVEGRHFVIEYTLTQSAAEMPAAAAELVARRVDVIVASGTPSVMPARDATSQIPVVFVATWARVP